MIKFQELKKGDYVLAEYDGKTAQGEIVRLNTDEKQVCVNNGTQDFWFKADQLKPLILNDEELMKLKFQRQDGETGAVKYSKGAFRILIPEKDNFSRFEIWYRDEKRQIFQPIGVHQLQNHYFEMTKVHLNGTSF